MRGAKKARFCCASRPSLIDYVLSKNLADGVVIAGCAESACFHRLGVAWTEQRFAGQRDPYLARVPRERIKTIWTSALETRRFEAELKAFATEVARLPPPGCALNSCAGLGSRAWPHKVAHPAAVLKPKSSPHRRALR